MKKTCIIWCYRCTGDRPNMIFVHRYYSKCIIFPCTCYLIVSAWCCGASVRLFLLIKPHIALYYGSVM